MKKEICFILAMLWWVVLLMWLAPKMVSAKSDALVIGGILLILVSAYATYRGLRRFLDMEKKS